MSNVINAPHIVREETRQRVREAIIALGYRANQAARQMRTGRSRLLAVRLEPTRDGINGSVLDRFLRGLTEAACVAGYRVLIYTAGNDAAEVAIYDDLLRSYDLDGFVITGTDHGDVRIAWLADRDVPFVTFGRPWDAPESHPWVDVDNAAGSAQATRRLVDTGHRRIGFLGWPVGSGVGDERRSGWRTAMRAAGLNPTAELDLASADGVEQGELAVRELLTLDPPPTGLVCASDSLALGALNAVRALGVELAITGYDDTPVARAVGLTSVSQPLSQAASSCVELLTGVLDGAAADVPGRVLLQPSLVVRQTA